MSEVDPEVPVPGKTRCVNERGQVSYVNDATAQNKHWQRSTGYKPKPLPAVENLPPLTEPKHIPEAEPKAPAVAATADEFPEPKKKQGRPAKTQTN